MMILGKFEFIYKDSKPFFKSYWTLLLKRVWQPGTAALAKKLIYLRQPNCRGRNGKKLPWWMPLKRLGGV